MSVQSLEQHTYLPEPEDQAAEVLSYIRAYETAHGARPELRYFLAGADEGDHVELPETVYRALRQVLEALAAGKAVTVAPSNKLLTTQQAADLLGVSRPTVIKLIDQGQLAAHTPGSKRRMLKLDDVLSYRSRRREAQYRALLDTAVDDYELDEDPREVADSLRRVRAEVAGRRRTRREV